MSRALPAIAAVIGMILVAGTNAILALGLGFLGLAAYFVVNELFERLDRIETSVSDLQHEAEARRLNEDLAERPESSP